MTPSQELEAIYASIGNGAECTDALLARIDELEATINPKPVEVIEPEVIEGVCGDPYCNGHCCWECAAIRGGSPMDV